MKTRLNKIQLKFSVIILSLSNITFKTEDQVLGGKKLRTQYRDSFCPLFPEHSVKCCAHSAELRVSCEDVCLWPQYKTYVIFYEWFVVLHFHMQVWLNGMISIVPSWGMTENGRESTSVKPSEVSLNKQFINPGKWIALKKQKMVDSRCCMADTNTTL